MKKIFSIFGNPVSHSLSPIMHNFVMTKLGLEGEYLRTKIQRKEEIREKIFSLNLNGVNITVPFKEDAFRLCDEVKGIASLIGSVNTIVLEDSSLIGYNTDAMGFYRCIEPFGKIKTALVLGAGGSAKAVAEILAINNIEVTVINRSHERLEYFKQRQFKTFSHDEFYPEGFDILINTTSAGLIENTFPLEEKLLILTMKKSNYVVDIIYNKMTPFLKLAKSLNLPYKDGKDMLVFQGALAFNLFFSNEFDERMIAEYMQKALSLNS